MDYNKLEVLAPAGDAERLAAAIDYGADAVYLGAQSFGMRAAPQNFTEKSLAEAVELAHSRGVKVYLTANTLPRNNEIPEFEGFIKNAYDCGADAVIAADIGLLTLIKKFTPDMEIHISTQTGIVNYAAADALYNMGAKRVVLARELSLEEIAEIRAKTAPALDIEAFVHGAMCMSFSGRCLLSQYMTNRDANRGECSQPCRWNYRLVEEKRPGQYFPVFEDDKGSYILNSKDLCMIEHIDEVAAAGVTSFKIEGRAKSSYYVAVVTNAYKMAVKCLKESKGQFILPDWLRDEVYKVSHREYCCGFFYGAPEQSQHYETSGYIREFDVAGVIENCVGGRIYAVQRNKFSDGCEAEILAPNTKFETAVINDLRNENGEKIDSANHAMMKFSFECDKTFPSGSIIRVKK